MTIDGSHMSITNTAPKEHPTALKRKRKKGTAVCYVKNTSDEKIDPTLESMNEATAISPSH